MFGIKKNSSRYKTQNFLTNDTRVVINKGLKNQIILDRKLGRSPFNEYLSLTDRLIELCSNFFINYLELVRTLETSIKTEMNRCQKKKIR